MSSPARDNTEEVFPALLLQVGGSLCALDARSVLEVSRPLPFDRIQGAPSFLLGLSRIRGRPTPVIDLAELLGEQAPGPAGRFVSLRLPERSAALAVTAVPGVRNLSSREVQSLPPLLSEARDADRKGVSALDDRLLWILDAGRIVPEATWSALGAGEGPR